MYKKNMVLIVSNTRQYDKKAYKSIEYIGFEKYEPFVLEIKSNEHKNRELRRSALL